MPAERRPPERPRPHPARSPRGNGVRKRPVAFVTGLGALGCFSLIAGGFAATSPDPNDRLLPGVQIAGIAVGELPVDQARERLRAWAREQMSLPIQVRHPESNKTWRWTVADISGRFDIDTCLRDAVAIAKDENILERWWYRDSPRDIQLQPRFLHNSSRLRRRLTLVAKQVDIAPVDARLGVVPKKGVFLARTERSGSRLDIEATANALETDGLDDGAQTDLILVEAKPRVTAQMLGGMGTLLASYSTYYGSSSSNRKHNVGIGAAQIDGTWMENGTVFSFNRSVGPRTASKGWRLAHQFQDGQVVDGIGGGVCQVSSTLYNAVLLGGLKIRERHNHSMPVAYLSPGRDATVSYGSLDFQFENNTGGPVYVQATADGRQLIFRLFGARPLAQTVRVVSGPTMPRADGGFSVQIFREWIAAGKGVRREDLGRDTYKPHPPEPAAKKPVPSLKKTAARPPVAVTKSPANPAGSTTPGPPQTSGTTNGEATPDSTGTERP